MIYGSNIFSSVINGSFYYDIFRDDLQLILHIINNDDFKSNVAQILMIVTTQTHN